MNGALRAADLALHARLGIPADLLERAGVRRVTHAEAREILGGNHSGDLAGILYPRVQPDTGRELSGCRVRRDHPEQEDGRPKNKYLSTPGRSHWFFPPGCGCLLLDPAVPMVIVEAEKSALALTAAAARTGRALLPIALGGAWNWKGRIGKTTDPSGARVDEHGPLPDFGLVAWSSRTVTILFDANAATNPSVRAARRGLVEELTRRGARVLLATLPDEPGVNGPDDYVAAHDATALFAIIDAAQPAIRPQDVPISELLAAHHLAEPVDDVPPEELEGRLRALRDEMTGADDLRRALVCAGLKKIAKIPAAIVNATFGGQHGPAMPAEGPSFLADEEPWSEPVSAATLLDETTEIIRRHVVLGENHARAAALWTAAAHAIDGLDSMPMLLLSSPTPECGKSTAAAVIGALVPRGYRVASLTPAVLFRMVHHHRPTLIADEADAWLNDEKSELRGVFNCAHDRHGAKIPRCVGDDNHIEVFDVFGAKLIAMIGKPPATMLSRSIVITLRRKMAGERAEPVRVERLYAELRPVRQRWRRWALDVLEALRAHDPDLPADLPINRTADNWRPLLAVADLAGGDWPTRARAAALELSGISSHGNTLPVELLQDVRTVFQEHGEPGTLSSEEIITALKAMTERPWADWNKGRGYNANQLARTLRDFGPEPHGLCPRQTRLGDKTGRRWHRDDFLDAWARYPRSDPEHPEHVNETAPEPAIAEPAHSPDVPAQEIAVQPMFTEGVPAVPAQVPEVPPSRTDDRWLEL